jgi:hypothetical protein
MLTFCSMLALIAWRESAMASISLRIDTWYYA